MVIVCSLLGGMSLLFFASNEKGMSTSNLKDINNQRHHIRGNEDLPKSGDYLTQREVKTNNVTSKIDSAAEDFKRQSTKETAEAPAIYHSPKQDGWDLEQERRKAILSKTCQQHPEWNYSLDTLSHQPDKLRHFLYNDEYKVIYCSICKVASTAWKSAFLVLMGRYKKVEDVNFGQWSKLLPILPSLGKMKNPEEIKRKLQTYKKFVFVREPFSRALSGYRNKLYKRNRYFEQLVGRKIIELFRKNATKMDLKTGIGVTFKEFLQHLTQTQPHELNPHWKPMYLITNPCAVQYDYIGHLETGAWDIENILNKTGLGKVVNIPKLTSNLSNSDDIFSRFYGDIDAELINATYETFRYDFQLFGYPVPQLIKDKLRSQANGTEEHR